jgi:hypothetical protein
MCECGDVRIKRFVRGTPLEKINAKHSFGDDLCDEKEAGFF